MFALPCILGTVFQIFSGAFIAKYFVEMAARADSQKISALDTNEELAADSLEFSKASLQGDSSVAGNHDDAYMQIPDLAGEMAEVGAAQSARGVD